jgi:hypothetical protein
MGGASGILGIMPDHVFAYGSLVAQATDAAPRTVLRGFRRTWGVAMDNGRAIPGYKVYLAPDGSRPDVCVAFLDLEHDPGATVQGVLLTVDPAGLAALDERERQYERADVSRAVQGAPGRVWTYLGRPESRERLRQARAQGRAVVQAAYARSVAAFCVPDLPVRRLQRIEVPPDPALRVPSSAMGKIEGSATAEIDAPLERCYELAADVDHISEWQGGVQQVEVLERDAEGRVSVARISNDAKVRVLTSTVRFSYDPPDGLSWSQTKGDLKSVEGRWRFEPAGDGRTRATYHLVGDPGRMLGMLVRGPVEGRIRDLLVKARPGELKRRAEAG